MTRLVWEQQRLRVGWQLGQVRSPACGRRDSHPPQDKECWGPESPVPSGFSEIAASDLVIPLGTHL